MPSTVPQAIRDYLDTEIQLGGYKTEQLRQGEIQEFYQEAATFLRCEPENIAFAYNATNAYARALSSINFKEGDCIITTDDDYVSNYTAFIAMQKRFNIRIERAKIAF